MRRMLIAVPMALIFTLFMFMFMAWMVNHKAVKAPEESELLSVDMVMAEQESETQVRHREPPKPPQPPEVQPQQPDAVTPPEPTQTMQPMASLEPTGLNTTVEGIAVNAPKLGSFIGSAVSVPSLPVANASGNKQLMPIYRADPRYPPRAQRRRLEGHVVLSFTIDATGHTKEIKVVSASPEGVFEQEAIRALSKWKYQPQLVDGKGVAQTGQTVNIEFKMGK